MVPEPSPGASLAVPAAAFRLQSDARLARRAAAGDQRAFEAIYRRFHQDLYRFCLALTGNSQDAQDALQNAMVKVLRALPGEERQIKLKPWLYRIAHNEAMETIRKRRDHAELDAEQCVNPVEIAATAEARERLRRLLADLSELPERQRAALAMREMAGLGFDQIADSLGTSGAVARQTVYEARLSLRQMEAGREMSCDEVTRQLSDGDGRVARGREIRAHLRGCASCRAFREGIGERRAGFAAVAPLPIAAAAGLLHGATGVASASVGGGAGLGGVAGVGAGTAVATSAVVKSAAVVAIVAVAGVTAAERGGVIDVPIVGSSRSAPASDTANPGAEPGAAGAAGAQSGSAAGRGAEAGKAEDAGSGGDAGRAGGGQGSAANPTAKGSKAGGGHGAHRGRPEGMPSASSRGQETAAAKKAPAAPASPPGPGGEPPRRNGSEAAPESPPRPTPPPPPSEPPATGGSKNRPPPQATTPEPPPPPPPGPSAGGRGAGPP